ncbi:MAG TPA: carboxypeptidase regulatory-like domain-containing protein [Bacteroidota bacterium]|nr:carboxypeptidase regulatory-like domain-containing protein [Bacteroidota bacterium]
MMNGSRFCLCIVIGMHFAPLAFSGEVSGKVTFLGTPPKPVRLMITGDAVCLRSHKSPLYGEDVVVNPNGTLKNVVISVKEGLAGKTFTPPSNHVLLEQRGCQYIPHVVVLQVRQSLDVVNDDATLHNVHGLASENPPFNFAQVKQGQRQAKTFDRAEIFRVKCDVHSWMAAYICVLDNPYFAVTGDDGSYTLKNLPPGDYTLEAWHEKYGTQMIKVKVGGGGKIKADFSFPGK